MLSKELLHKVRMIEITTRKVVDDALSGQYRSHFRGQGVQFSEHRQYVPGDDVRHINWNVSARTREPLVKKYDEERELSVFLVVDVSASKEFGSESKLKSEIVAEIGGVLASAASLAGDRVGALFFASRVEKIVPPRKGRNHLLSIIRNLFTFKPSTQGTDLAGALEATDRIMKHKGVVFVLSDFIAEGYEVALNRLARRHDVVAVTVSDEREMNIPDVGHLLLMNPETGAEQFVDTSSYTFKKWFEAYRKTFETNRDRIFKGGRIESLKISKGDHLEELVKFFRSRARRRR